VFCHSPLDQEAKCCSLLIQLSLRALYPLIERACNGYRRQLKVTSLLGLVRLRIDQGIQKFQQVLEVLLVRVFLLLQALR